MSDLSNSLAGLDLPMSKYTEEEKHWGDVVTSASFLPRITLYGTNSVLVAENKITAGNFGVCKSKDVVDDLGKTFDCMPISWRFKAMEIKGETIINVHNPKSPEFIRIQGNAAVPDSGCMFGIEFLIWIPSMGIFATYFLNSKTARREAPNMKALLKQGMTLKSNLITKGKFRWYGPVVTQCSTPFNQPDPADVLDQATTFANPKESEVEAVAAGEVSSRPQ